MSYVLIRDVDYVVKNSDNISVFPLQINGTIMPSEIISESMQVKVRNYKRTENEIIDKELLEKHTREMLIHEIAKKLADKLTIESKTICDGEYTEYSVLFSVNDLAKLKDVNDRLESNSNILFTGYRGNLNEK